MANPNRELDVHMGTDGQNASCSFCHVPKDASGEGHHSFIGSHYTEAESAETLSCDRCHTASPHKTNDRLNQHTARVACQTCHIPAFARGGRATKMSWDWSTAGRLTAEGKTFVTKDAHGDPTYDSQKGTFVWQSDVTPEYIWFNGDVDYVTIDDVIDPQQTLRITNPGGNIADSKARIYPVKHFTGKQPYDAGAKTLAVPHLFARGTNDMDAYWKSFDWNRSLTAGMSAVGKSYSGQLGFIETEMFWVQNHMVAPKEKALACIDCHTPRGRLDFAALGYAADRAAQLQTMAGFEIGGVKADHNAAKVEVRWQGTPGKSYKVQSSQDLKQWSDAQGGQLGPVTSSTELIWSEASASASRYYRIIRTP
jgi:octaheme c-type cytochrome (tetrathionate reductase family)